MRTLCLNCCNRCHVNAVKGLSALWFTLLTIKTLFLRLRLTMLLLSIVFFQFAQFVTIIIDTRESLLVSLEVKIETYGHSTGSQFNAIFKCKSSCPWSPLTILDIHRNSLYKQFHYFCTFCFKKLSGKERTLLLYLMSHFVMYWRILNSFRLFEKGKTYITVLLVKFRTK
jgi:hypothetical protein